VAKASSFSFSSFSCGVGSLSFFGGWGSLSFFDGWGSFALDVGNKPRSSEMTLARKSAAAAGSPHVEQPRSALNQ